jgi:uncharacterized protein (TIGR02594 family)
MKITRREASIGLASMLASPLFAQTPSWQQDLQSAVDQNSSITLGRRLPPPDSPLWAQAHALLDAAPLRVSPIEVARYFERSVPPRFQQAWPEPNRARPTDANPLIVLLFLATKMTPSGDQTPWCAAFMNWCLARSGITGTRSASSQSFTRWGRERWRKGESDLPTSGQVGDIAVFTSRSDPSHGHVAFYNGVVPNSYRRVSITGGNQIVRGVHLINTMTLRTDRDLELTSIRAV